MSSEKPQETPNENDTPIYQKGWFIAVLIVSCILIAYGVYLFMAFGSPTNKGKSIFKILTFRG